MNELLRVYFDPTEIGEDGYPLAWHKFTTDAIDYDGDELSLALPIKDLIRERDGHRCLRCGHPYRKGEHGNGEWSPCDGECEHRGPLRYRRGDEEWTSLDPERIYADDIVRGEWEVEAQWRILTVHHLNGVKHDCRWWNLVSLCQRCHLRVQRVVVMERVWPWEHSDWFKPFAAAWYASAYLGEELTREQVDQRLDELLALERVA